MDNSGDSKKRIEHIDFLKVIGIICIMIAHVNPPDWVLMIRNFDVQLLVIISSMLARKSYERYIAKGEPALKFLTNRVKRLVYPTWIFLIIYFIFIFLFTNEKYGKKYYIYSFLFTRYGIGYVWIILIYLYVALYIPLFYKVKNKKYTWAIIFFVYALEEVFYYLSVGVNYKIIETTFYYIIPYGILAYLGFKYCDINLRIKRLIIVCSILCYLAGFIYYYILCGTPQNVQLAKYPPRIYYLSYGIAVSFILIVLCEKYVLAIYKNSVIRYISANSLLIYLWHILILKICEKLSFPNNWILKFVVVFSFSLIIVIIIKWIEILIKEYRKKIVG